MQLDGPAPPGPFPSETIRIKRYSGNERDIAQVMADRMRRIGLEVALQTMQKVLGRLRRMTFGGARTARDRGINRINVGVLRAGVSCEYHESRAAQLPDFCELVVAHRSVTGGRPKVAAVAPHKLYGSDAAHLAAAAMQGLVYGPGGKYHTMPGERVYVPDLLAAAKVRALVTARITGRGGRPGQA